MGDEQDLAEVFDETNITEDGEDIAHPDMAPNLFDVTREDEDSDEDEDLGEDFDPDTASDDELDRMLERDDGVDDDEPVGPDDADRVTTENDESADFEPSSLSQGDLEDLGYATAPRALTTGSTREARLDEGLEETFPASDPVSINPGAN
jgi:hypothetical protein